MRERSTMYATGAGQSALLEADRGGAWLRPLFVVLAAVTLALAATMLVRPGVALAAPSPLVDDTTADFGAGTNNGTQVTGDIGNGAVTVAPDKPGLEEQFDGTELPAGWTVTSVWNAGGTATVANGELTPDAVQVQSDAAFGSGRTLEFAATFREGNFQNVGFTTSFNGGPGDSWAAFGRGNTAPGVLLARTNVDGVMTDVPVVCEPCGSLVGTEHVYRIEWTSTEVRYLVDGTLVHTQPATITDEMRVSASDFPLDGEDPSIDYFRVLPAYSTTPGQFTSRVLEADGTADWAELTAATQTPAGTNVTFETRSGSTTEELEGAAWQPVGPGGAIASPDGKYIQYRATLNTSDPSVRPAVEQVFISYELADGTAPKIGPKKPKGKTTDRTLKVVAVVRDGQSELSRDDINLFVDGKAKTSFSYNAETDTLTHDSRRLSYGSHTVRIEAKDEAGNEASESWRFRIVKKR